MPFGLVDCNQYFERDLLPPSSWEKAILFGITSQKTVMFIMTDMRTSNLTSLLCGEYRFLVKLQVYCIVHTIIVYLITVSLCLGLFAGIL
jgi:hypothetical protein